MNLNLIGPNPHIDITGTFSSRGIAVIEYALPAADLAHMDAICPRLPPRTGGARAADFIPEARAWLTAHDGLLALARRLLDTPVCLTRLQAFDKSGASNWFVPWHQDRAADGQERPVVRLEASVALRIHLDDCTEDNGPLDVIPGSHRYGRLTADAIAARVAATPSELCLCARGDIAALSPLLIHRSQRARQPAARRVIHLEYTAQSLIPRAAG